VIGENTFKNTNISQKTRRSNWLFDTLNLEFRNIMPAQLIKRRNLGLRFSIRTSRNESVP